MISENDKFIFEKYNKIQEKIDRIKLLISIFKGEQQDTGWAGYDYRKDPSIIFRGLQVEKAIIPLLETELVGCKAEQELLSLKD